MKTLAYNRTPVDLKAYGPFPTIAEIEKRLIFQALKKTSGDKRLAAQLLGITLRALRNKLHRYAAKTGH
jgi:DNA-binding NtrC family response regulator